MQPVSKADDMLARGGALSERQMLTNTDIRGGNSSLMICLLCGSSPKNLRVAILQTLHTPKYGKSTYVRTKM